MDGSNLSARDRFLSLAPTGFPPHEDIDVPGFGPLKIKVLTAGERDRFEMQHIDENKQDFRARLVAATAIDERGAKIFADDDISQLSNLPAHILDPLVKVAARVNRLTDDDNKELRKN